MQGELLHLNIAKSHSANYFFCIMRLQIILLLIYSLSIVTAQHASTTFKFENSIKNHPNENNYW